MKKTYINPEIAVIKIHTAALMSGSPQAPLDPDQVVDNPGNVGSRFFDADFDDEEDW